MGVPSRSGDGRDENETAEDMAFQPIKNMCSCVSALMLEMCLVLCAFVCGAVVEASETRRALATPFGLPVLASSALESDQGVPYCVVSSEITRR